MADQVLRLHNLRKFASESARTHSLKLVAGVYQCVRFSCLPNSQPVDVDSVVVVAAVVGELAPDSCTVLEQCSTPTTAAAPSLRLVAGTGTRRRARGSAHRLANLRNIGRFEASRCTATGTLTRLGAVARLVACGATATAPATTIHATLFE